MALAQLELVAESTDSQSSDDELRSRSDSGDSLLDLPVSLPRTRRSDSDSQRGSGSPRIDGESVDLSYCQLTSDEMDANLLDIEGRDRITTLNLSGNDLQRLPNCVGSFVSLKILDVSENRIANLDDGLTKLTCLTTLILSNNQLDDDSLPKDFGSSLAPSLKVLSLGGNRLRIIPNEVLELTQLRTLYLGGNHIREVSKDIKRLENLRVLYLGGNQLTAIPDEVGQLRNLQALNLCENKLRALPPSIAMLRHLKSLALHKNLLTTLPLEIVKLNDLIELSLRNNPLIVRFIRDMAFNTPTLMELAARSVKINRVPYSSNDLPRNIVAYLKSAHRCVNPKCKGVFFDNCVEHIKFVDFCGVYRLPLLHYLCSFKCTSNDPAVAVSSEDDESELESVPFSKLKRVLLG